MVFIHLCYFFILFFTDFLKDCHSSVGKQSLCMGAMIQRKKYQCNNCYILIFCYFSRWQGRREIVSVLSFACTSYVRVCVRVAPDCLAIFILYNKILKYKQRHIIVSFISKCFLNIDC